MVHLLSLVHLYFYKESLSFFCPIFDSTGNRKNPPEAVWRTSGLKQRIRTHGHLQM